MDALPSKLSAISQIFKRLSSVMLVMYILASTTILPRLKISEKISVTSEKLHNETITKAATLSFSEKTAQIGIVPGQRRSRASLV